MDGMNASLNSKMDGVKASLNSKMDGVKASLNGKMDGVKEDMGQLHQEFSTLSELEATIEDMSQIRHYFYDDILVSAATTCLFL
ncbi:hypothetical protein ACOMHN_008225 [Nucella lapillus]